MGKRMYWKELRPIILRANRSKITLKDETEVVTIQKFFETYLLEFARGSSFHGLGHITQSDRHWSERLLWTIILLTSVGLTAYVGGLAWHRYDNFPTVIIMEKNYREWNISFPTAIICPSKRIDQGALFKLAESYRVKDKSGFIRFFTALASSEFETFNYLPDYYEISPDNFLDIIVQASWNFSYAFSSTLGNKHEILIPMLTEIGICYTYNSKIAPFFNPNTLIGKENRAERNHTLRYTNILDGESFATIDNMKSPYNVTIIGPYEVPYVGTPLLEADNRGLLQIEVECLPLISTLEVINLPIRKRNCMTREDGSLRLSSIYSYNLCRMECRLNFALKFCGCIPYMYVTDESKDEIEKLPICDVKGMKCLARNGTLVADLRDPVTKEKLDCSCLALCTDYHFQINSVGYSIRFDAELTWKMLEYPKLRYKRIVSYNFSDLLVSVGASAGLFLGCSVLSFLEIIYYATLRLSLELYRKREKRTMRKVNRISQGPTRLREFLH